MIILAFVAIIDILIAIKRRWIPFFVSVPWLAGSLLLVFMGYFFQKFPQKEKYHA